MPIPNTLGYGVFLISLLLVALLRPRHPRRRKDSPRPPAPASDEAAPAAPIPLDPPRSPAPSSDEPPPGARVPLDRLPDSASLAGVPLRILLSDRSGPGSLLKDTLTTRPSTRDP